jgi:Stress responsive A/B Barrel Domain
MIRHTAAFCLKHAANSAAETGFFAALRNLQFIPGVEDFEILRQISPKSEFTFCVSMVFADEAAYNGYNIHPDHVAFVNNRWLPEVAAFTELDYISL